MTLPATLVATLLVASGAAPAPARERSGARPAFDVRSFGARGDGRTDDSRALQAALDAARAAGGGVVHVPAGTYLIGPPPGPPGKPGTGSITIGSGTWLRGDGPASVLKVKDAVGSYRALFTGHPGPETPLEDVTLSDLRIDQNCGASGGVVGPGGADFVVFLAWGGKNLTVERARFDPVCGVNTVVLNAPTARNLVVRDSTFRFVKGPSTAPGGEYDNSAVYLHGRGAVVTGNLFEAAPADRARGAIELHGAGGLAAGNVTRGYRSCVRVVGTSEPGEAPPETGNGFSVTGNVCLDANDAINVWALTGNPVRGVTIMGNAITLAELSHLSAAGRLEHFSGISFVWDAVSGKLDGAVEDVVIEGNTISAQPTAGRVASSAYSSAGISLTPAGSLSNVVVRGNVIRDLPSKGIHVQAMGRGARASQVRIEGNVLLDPGHDPSAGPHRAGIVVAGLLEDVEVARNTIAATRTPFQGLDAIRATAEPGSARVGVHDNVWTAVGEGAGYRLSVRGAVDAGPSGRVRSTSADTRPGATLTFDASQAGIWDVTVRGSGPVAVQAPSGAVAGQRLTIRIRNGGAGPLGPFRWEGFKLGPWTSPGPGAHRILEVVWDGADWQELYQSNHDIPN